MAEKYAFDALSTPPNEKRVNMTLLHVPRQHMHSTAKGWSVTMNA
jgi:hypothetical protein